MREAETWVNVSPGVPTRRALHALRNQEQLHIEYVCSTIKVQADMSVPRCALCSVQRSSLSLEFLSFLARSVLDRHLKRGLLSHARQRRVSEPCVRAGAKPLHEAVFSARPGPPSLVWGFSGRGNVMSRERMKQSVIEAIDVASNASFER